MYIHCYRLLLRLVAIDCNDAVALDLLYFPGGVSSTSVPQTHGIYVVLYLGVHTTASHYIAAPLLLWHCYDVQNISV